MDINFDKFLTKDDVIVVGVSGGADSMCLLSLLFKASKKIGFKLIAVHINHNLRKGESDRDEMFVASFCKKQGIEFIARKVDVLSESKQNKKGIEEVARALRYEAFNKIMEEKGANKLFIAHNKNDQAETCLMHILRGSSIRGASGMKEVSGKIYRPLINTKRTEIEEYNKKNNIDFIIDSSNDSLNYTRNYVRHVVMPTLEKMYPNAIDALCSFARHCSEDDAFINSCVSREYITRTDDAVVIDKKALNLPLPIISRLIFLAIDEVSSSKDIDKTHIKLIIELANKKSGSKISLPNNIEVHKSYQGIVFALKQEPFSAELPFKEGKTIFGDKIIEIRKAKEVSYEKGKHFFDISKMPKDAVFRTRQVKDRFKKVNSPSKSLGDYLTDSKVDKRLRDNLVLIASGNEVLFVEGQGIADSIKIDASSQQIYEVIIKNSK